MNINIIKSYFHSFITSLITIEPQVEFYIFGGAMSNILSFGKVVNDIDIGFPSESNFKKFDIAIKAIGYQEVLTSPVIKKYVSINNSIDSISYNYLSPYDRCKLIDLNMCSAVLTHDFKLYYVTGFWEDNYNREMVINIFNEKTTERITKYTQQGFKLTKQASSALIEYKGRWAELDREREVELYDLYDIEVDYSNNYLDY
jgi:hypothetical protein